MFKEYVYIVHSKTNEEAIYAEYDNFKDALEYARENSNYATSIEQVTVYRNSDNGTTEGVGESETIWEAQETVDANLDDAPVAIIDAEAPVDDEEPKTVPLSEEALVKFGSLTAPEFTELRDLLEKIGIVTVADLEYFVSKFPEEVNEKGLLQAVRDYVAEATEPLTEDLILLDVSDDYLDNILKELEEDDEPVEEKCHDCEEDSDCDYSEAEYGSVEDFINGFPEAPETDMNPVDYSSEMVSRSEGARDLESIFAELGSLYDDVEPHPEDAPDLDDAEEVAVEIAAPEAKDAPALTINLDREVYDDIVANLVKQLEENEARIAAESSEEKAEVVEGCKPLHESSMIIETHYPTPTERIALLWDKADGYCVEKTYQSGASADLWRTDWKKTYPTERAARAAYDREVANC